PARRRRGRPGPLRLRPSGTGRRPGLRPDEKDRARRVVDDLAGGRPEAVGPAMSAVAVPRADEDVESLRRGQHLLRDVAAAREPGRVAPEERLRVREQLLGTLLRDELRGWVRLRVMPAEK